MKEIWLPWKSNNTMTIYKLYLLIIRLSSRCLYFCVCSVSVYLSYIVRDLCCFCARCFCLPYVLLNLYFHISSTFHLVQTGVTFQPFSHPHDSDWRFFTSFFFVCFVRFCSFSLFSFVSFFRILTFYLLFCCIKYR